MKWKSHQPTLSILFPIHIFFTSLKPSKFGQQDDIMIETKHWVLQISLLFQRTTFELPPYEITIFEVL